MSFSLDQRVRTLLASDDAVKVLVTSDEDRVPHAVIDPALRLDEAGRLVYRERLESSRTQRDLVRSLWFDGRVAVIVAARDGRTFRVEGRPVKAHVAGPVFRAHHEALRADDPAADLAAVWEIEPTDLTEETYPVARDRQDEQRPFLKHLDLLARS